jgi:hypothetical protein
LEFYRLKKIIHPYSSSLEGYPCKFNMGKFRATQKKCYFTLTHGLGGGGNIEQTAIRVGMN